MIKRTLSYIVLAVMMSLLGGCTTNNGDIGIWYGLWSLDRLTVDGADDTAYNFDGWTNFAFQNNVVLITKTNQLADVTECYGTWQQDGDEMVFDYNHHDNLDEQSQQIYNAPAWIYFAAKSVTRCRILSSDSKTVTLQQVTADGKTVTYYLSKQH